MRCKLFSKNDESKPLGWIKTDGETPPQAIQYDNRIYALHPGLSSDEPAYKEVSLYEVTSSDFEAYDENKVGQVQTA